MAETELALVEDAPLVTAQNALDMVADATVKARKLAEIITKNEVYSNIQGKKYVKCEGWTTLGAMMGVFPHIEWTHSLDDGGGFEARCLVKRADGAVLGAAEAQCGMDEKMWAGRTANARRSMAQTRATSKAMRVVFSWVMTLAGYEATPAEEMDFDQAPQRPPKRSATPKKAAPREAEPVDASDPNKARHDLKTTLDAKYPDEQERVQWMEENAPKGVRGTNVAIGDMSDDEVDAALAVLGNAD